MTDNVVYRQLERPWLYRLAQLLAGRGAADVIRAKIRALLDRMPKPSLVLDVGCGPESWLWSVGLHPVGLDVSQRYTATFGAAGEPAVSASAAALPFHDRCFDQVWSIGVLHHLPDEIVRPALAEMQRVTRPGGSLLVLDAVLPQPAWRRPVAYALRRLDRGGFVRRQAAFEALLPHRTAWEIDRYNYSPIGHEMLVCRWQPS